MPHVLVELLALEVDSHVFAGMRVWAILLDTLRRRKRLSLRLLHLLPASRAVTVGTAGPFDAWPPKNSLTSSAIFLTKFLTRARKNEKGQPEGWPNSLISLVGARGFEPRQFVNRQLGSWRGSYRPASVRCAMFRSTLWHQRNLIATSSPNALFMRKASVRRAAVAWSWRRSGGMPRS